MGFMHISGTHVRQFELFGFRLNFGLGLQKHKESSQKPGSLILPTKRSLRQSLIKGATHVLAVLLLDKEPGKRNPRSL